MAKQKVIRFDLWPDHSDAGGHDALPWLDLRTPPPPLEYLFTYQGAPMIAAANFHLFKGEEKAGKSAAGLALIVAALSGSFLGITPSRDGISVLWIDTEQDASTLFEKVQAAAAMAGLTQMPEDRVRVMTLRGCGGPADALDKVVRGYAEHPADLVFIDGVVDLCEAPNDDEKSRETWRQIERLAVRGAAVLGVIHTTYATEKARGHLGSILQTKAGEIYLVEKPEGGTTATWKQTRSRFKPVDSIEFEFQDNFRIAATGQEKTFTEAESYANMYRRFAPLFADVEQMRYKEVVRAYMDYHDRKESAAKKAVSFAVELRVLEKSMDGSTVYYSLPFSGVTPNNDEDSI